MEVKKGATGRITGLTDLLSDITRDDVLRVLSAFSMSAAEEQGFADSTDFDLVFEGGAFPPKAVLGLAAERVVGRPLKSDEFSGGEGSSCFRILRVLGFTIQPKSVLHSTFSSAGTRLSPTSLYPFKVGSRYSRRDVFDVLGIDDPSGGPWYTGYASYGGDWFIFCGVGAAGRTGHDYGNHFEGDDLLWHGKSQSSVRHKSIQGLLKPSGRTYVFCREDDRSPFTFAGVGTPKQVRDVTPVEVLWQLSPVTNAASRPEVLPEEIAEPATVVEGAKKTVTVNAYERDRTARERCIAHWGVVCVVCGFDFERRYGALGVGFIHVHHLKPLAEIGERYHLDPVQDLRPVCPNCHAMLHRSRQVLSIQQLRRILENQGGAKG